MYFYDSSKTPRDSPYDTRVTYMRVTLYVIIKSFGMYFYDSSPTEFLWVITKW